MLSRSLDFWQNEGLISEVQNRLYYGKTLGELPRYPHSSCVSEEYNVVLFDPPLLPILRLNDTTPFHDRPLSPPDLRPGRDGDWSIRSGDWRYPETTIKPVTSWTVLLTIRRRVTIVTHYSVKLTHNVKCMVKVQIRGLEMLSRLFRSFDLGSLLFPNQNSCVLSIYRVGPNLWLKHWGFGTSRTLQKIFHIHESEEYHLLHTKKLWWKNFSTEKFI